jgi:Cu/Zn superoxide dismutase
MGKKRASLLAALAVVMLTAPPALANGEEGAHTIRSAGPLRDLSLATTDVTDGAFADVKATVHGSSMHVKLRLEGLLPAFAGQAFGAHVHSGSCLAGNGAAAGPHYNAGGGVSDHTEVWLDFTVGQNGRAKSDTHVEFTIPAGAASAVVIHALVTAPDGTAGARLACLPVPF